MQRLAVQGQDHVGDRAAAHAHQRRAQPHQEAVSGHAGTARQFVREPPTLAPEQKLHRDQARDDRKRQLEQGARRERGQHRSERDAEDGRSRP